MDGSPASGRLSYAGITRRGGAINAIITLGGAATAVLRADAIVTVGGTYTGIVKAPRRCVSVWGRGAVAFVSATQSVGSIEGDELIAGSTEFTLIGSDAEGGYTGVLRITTEEGILVSNRVGTFRPDGTFSEQGTIDGQRSTGGFAAASGALAITGSTLDGVTFEEEIEGQLCLVELNDDAGG